MGSRQFVCGDSFVIIWPLCKLEAPSNFSLPLEALVARNASFQGIFPMLGHHCSTEHRLQLFKAAHNSCLVMGLYFISNKCFCLMLLSSSSLSTLEKLPRGTA